MIPQDQDQLAIRFNDLKCSFFLADVKGNSKLLIKVEEGRFNGIIVEVSNFNFQENTSNLTFDYDIIYNPYKKPPAKSLETFLKATMRKIIITSLEAEMERQKKEEANASRNANTEKPVTK